MKEPKTQADVGEPSTCASTGTRWHIRSASVVEAIESIVTFQPMLAT